MVACQVIFVDRRVGVPESDRCKAGTIESKIIVKFYVPL